MVNVAEHRATQWLDGGLAGSSQGWKGSSLEEGLVLRPSSASRCKGTTISMPAIAGDAIVSVSP